jgi:hypothetical protein
MGIVQRTTIGAQYSLKQAALIGIALICHTAGLSAETSSDPDEMLLHNKFGELCTMCEATVVCASRDVSNVTVDELNQATGGPYTLYHFHTKTFLGQIATIYDYLIRWIEPVITEKRPVTIYAIPAAGDASVARARTETNAELSLEPPVIAIDKQQIERRSREWRSADGQALGSCKRLPLRDTWAFLQANAPWPEHAPPRAAMASE